MRENVLGDYILLCFFVKILFVFKMFKSELDKIFYEFRSYFVVYVMYILWCIIYEYEENYCSLK